MLQYFVLVLGYLYVGLYTEDSQQNILFKMNANILFGNNASENINFGS
jgi:hypothetical protein